MRSWSEPKASRPKEWEIGSADQDRRDIVARAAGKGLELAWRSGSGVRQRRRIWQGAVSQRPDLRQLRRRADGVAADREEGAHLCL